MAEEQEEEVGMTEASACAATRELSVREVYAAARTQRGDPTLALYFNDLSGHPVLTQPQEASVAHHIQDLEVREWVELLSHPPVL